MAAPFRFGLQRVRDIRVHDEEQAKERFAASLAQRAGGHAALESAEQRLLVARRGTVAGLEHSAVSGIDLRTRQAWVERLERSRVDAEARLQGLDHDLRYRRTELTAASQRREVLDQLESRQRDAHRLVEARREGAELDEMAITGFLRGRRAA